MLRPRKREPVLSCIAPTRRGPMVAPRGNSVRISPRATVTSLGARRMSRGMVESTGGTAMAQMPAPSSRSATRGMESTRSIVK